MADRIKKINKDITSYLYSLSDSFTILSNYFKKLAQLSEQSSKKKINKNVISKEKIKNEKEEDNKTESNNKFLSKKRKNFNNGNLSINDLETNIVKVNINKNDTNLEAYEIKFKIKNNYLTLGPYDNLTFCENVKESFKESINEILTGNDYKKDLDSLFKTFKIQLNKEFPPIS